MTYHHVHMILLSVSWIVLGAIVGCKQTSLPPLSGLDVGSLVQEAELEFEEPTSVPERFRESEFEDALRKKGVDFEGTPDERAIEVEYERVEQRTYRITEPRENTRPPGTPFEMTYREEWSGDRKELNTQPVRQGASLQGGAYVPTSVRGTQRDDTDSLTARSTGGDSTPDKSAGSDVYGVPALPGVPTLDRSKIKARDPNQPVQATTVRATRPHTMSSGVIRP